MQNYAPVVIPTLNRYHHLKNCIESLARNKLAENTDLYISVDYPPAARYQEGYQDVLDYLNGGIQGFHSVNIYFQKTNLGPGENGQFLYQKAWEHSDRLIFTEDDNIFSVNFLEYMNVALEKYRNTPEIYAVSGYCWPVSYEMEQAELFRTAHFSAWGVGFWKDRWEAFSLFRRQDLVDYLSDHGNRKRLKHWNYHLYKQAVYLAAKKHHMQCSRSKDWDGELRDADFIVSLFQFITNRQTIVPFLSKVRNTGHDGSGENCDSGEAALFTEQIIDERDHIGTIEAVELNEANSRLLKEYLEKKDRTDLWERIKMLIWVMRFKRSAE